MRDELLDQIGQACRPQLVGADVVVFCSYGADTREWRRVLHAAGAREVLVLAFDNQLAALLPQSGTLSAPQLVADRHTLIATLAERSPLADLVDRFDPDRRAAVLVTDPLDPPMIGARPRFGGKHPAWQLFEHKAAVDVLWDAIDLARAESVVFDEPATICHPGGLSATQLVFATQRRGGQPSAGGTDVRWSTRGELVCPPVDEAVPFRIRTMPLLAGTPCRLHGMVLAHATAVFTPLELLVPRRPADGAFLCAGVNSLPEPDWPELVALTRSIGEKLRARIRYRGGFAVDGILTTDGFRPTDLNTRVTSAFEAASPPVRVAVHASALLARADLPGPDPTLLERSAGQALTGAAHLVLHAVATGGPQPATASRSVRWDGSILVTCDPDEAHAILEITQAPRGQMLTVQLRRDVLPPDLPLQEVAVAAFRAADELLGTRLGRLVPPPGSRRAVPIPRPGTA